MLTASEIYKGLSTATPAQKHELIMSKLKPRVIAEGAGARALVWGTRFEPIAKDIYSREGEHLAIVDTTCVPHPTVPFLGASPDGILMTSDLESPRYGRLVEFKCPISRVFTDDSPIPDAYVHQMQLQMECTGLRVCEYVEFQFRTPTYTEWVNYAGRKGFFAVSDDETKVIYKDLDDTRDPATWREQMLPSEEWYLVYWTLEKYRMKQVDHDPEWLPTHLPSFTEIWKTVQEHRAAGTVPDHPKEKTILMI